MKTVVAIIGSTMSLALAQPAKAEIVYLDCTLSHDNGKSVTHLDVTLNEDSGNAGFVIRETGWSPQKLTAAFTPRDVTFFTPTELRSTSTQYRIDRTDLSFSEESKIGDKSFWRRGKCVLAPKVERKF